jgi:hypothetical protein
MAEVFFETIKQRYEVLDSTPVGLRAAVGAHRALLPF